MRALRCTFLLVVVAAVTLTAAAATTPDQAATLLKADPDCLSACSNAINSCWSECAKDSANPSGCDDWCHSTWTQCVKYCDAVAAPALVAPPLVGAGSSDPFCRGDCDDAYVYQARTCNGNAGCLNKASIVQQRCINACPSVSVSGVAGAVLEASVSAPVCDLPGCEDACAGACTTAYDTCTTGFPSSCQGSTNSNCFAAWLRQCAITYSDCKSDCPRTVTGGKPLASTPHSQSQPVIAVVDHSSAGVTFDPEFMCGRACYSAEQDCTLDCVGQFAGLDVIGFEGCQLSCYNAENACKAACPRSHQLSTRGSPTAATVNDDPSDFCAFCAQCQGKPHGWDCMYACTMCQQPQLLDQGVAVTAQPTAVAANGDSTPSSCLQVCAAQYEANMKLCVFTSPDPGVYTECISKAYETDAACKAACGQGTTSELKSQGKCDTCGGTPREKCYASCTNDLQHCRATTAICGGTGVDTSACESLCPSSYWALCKAECDSKFPSSSSARAERLRARLGTGSV